MVKQWTSSAEMYNKITSHWAEKDKGIHGKANVSKMNVKHEIWDGSRFAELSWFWVPKKSWCLSARCECQSIISSHDVLLAPQQDNYRELYCSRCSRMVIQEILLTLVKLKHFI